MLFRIRFLRRFADAAVFRQLFFFFSSLRCFDADD